MLTDVCTFIQCEHVIDTARACWKCVLVPSFGRRTERAAPAQDGTNERTGLARGSFAVTDALAIFLRTWSISLNPDGRAFVASAGILRVLWVHSVMTDCVKCRAVHQFRALLLPAGLRIGRRQQARNEEAPVRYTIYICMCFCPLFFLYIYNLNQIIFWVLLSSRR